MEHETIVLILAFLIGWVRHAVYSFVLNLGRTAYMVKFVNYALMCTAKLVSEQVVEFFEIKYKSLSQMGVEKNKIKLMINEDRIVMDSMREDIVKLFIENYPKPFTHHIDFKNWKQMMQHISDNQRRNNA